MIDRRKISGKRYLVGFHGGLFCTNVCFRTNACGCIFKYVIIWYCRRNRVTCSGLFVLCIVIYGKMRVIYDCIVIHFHTNKISEERPLFLTFGLCWCSWYIFIQKNIFAGSVERIISFLIIVSCYYYCGCH